MDDLIAPAAKKSPLPAVLICAVLLGAVVGVYVLSAGDETPNDATTDDEDVEQTGDGNDGVDTGNSGDTGSQTNDSTNGQEPFNAPVLDSNHILIEIGSTVDISVGESGSTVASGNFPTGLSLNGQGNIVGTASTAVRNSAVTIENNGASQNYSITVYDLSADHSALATGASSAFEDNRSGAPVIPLFKESLGFGMDKEENGLMGAGYINSSRVVILPSDGAIATSQGYSKNSILDNSIAWACGPNAQFSISMVGSSSIYTDNLRNDLVTLGYTEANMETASCAILSASETGFSVDPMAMIGAGKNLILMGDSDSIFSVGSGDYFLVGSSSVYSFDGDEESYSAYLNLYNSIDYVTSSDAVEGTESAYIERIMIPSGDLEFILDLSDYGPSFMENLHMFANRTQWPEFSPTSVVSSLDQLQNVRFRILSASHQNLGSGEGFVNSNSATYPGAVNSTERTNITHELDVTTPIIDFNRGNNVACSQGYQYQITSAYAAPGETISVTVPESLANIGIYAITGIHCHNMVYAFGQEGYNRMPTMVVAEEVVSTNTEITSTMGGLVMFAIPEELSLGTQSVTISNVAQAPHFVTGTTTTSQWQDSLNDGVPWAVLETPNNLLAVPVEMIGEWQDPTATMEFLENGTTWLHWFHGQPDGWDRQEVWYTDIDLDNRDGVWMLGEYPVRSSHEYVQEDLISNNITSAVHWSILHEYVHVHEGTSPPWMLESWADFVVAAYYKMVHDLEVNQTYKDVGQNRTNYQSFINNHINANLSAASAGLGGYSLSVGFSLFWFVADDFGYEIFERAISSMNQDALGFGWDQWAVTLSNLSGANMAEYIDAFGIPLTQATLDFGGQYPTWANSPLPE